MGNRKTYAKTGTNEWSYNQNNELQGFDNTSYKYNLNGQMTEKTVNGVKVTYSYNLDGRLSEIKDNSGQVVAQYQYDPVGRRISKTLPQDNNKVVFFHYAEEGLIAEYSETGDLIQSYGYKPDSDFTTEPMFTHRPDFTEEKGYAFYINDHLDTPQKLILRNGRKVWEASADSFGKIIILNNEFNNPLHFPGQYKDDESELRYNWFRFYDSQLGRYITSDPIGIAGGINSFLYVGANPINYFDNIGLQKKKKKSKKKKGKTYGKNKKPKNNKRKNKTQEKNPDPKLADGKYNNSKKNKDGIDGDPFALILEMFGYQRVVDQTNMITYCSEAECVYELECGEMSEPVTVGPGVGIPWLPSPPYSEEDMPENCECTVWLYTRNL